MRCCSLLYNLPDPGRHEFRKTCTTQVCIVGSFGTTFAIPKGEHSTLDAPSRAPAQVQSITVGEQELEGRHFVPNEVLGAPATAFGGIGRVNPPGGPWLFGFGRNRNRHPDQIRCFPVSVSVSTGGSHFPPGTDWTRYIIIFFVGSNTALKSSIAGGFSTDIFLWWTQTDIIPYHSFIFYCKTMTKP